MKATILTVAAILVAVLAFLEFDQYRARVALQEKIRLAAVARSNEQEAARQREQAERNFVLSDAYKKPPVSHVESVNQRLYGRIVPMGGADLAWGAVTAQDLDAKLLADDIFSGRCAQAEARKARAVESFSRSMVEIASENPVLNPVDRNRQENNLIKAIQSGITEVYEPQRQSAVKAAFEERDTRLTTLAAEDRLVHLSRDVRVHVLDISGHYAKLRIIDGDQSGKIVFVSPNELLIK